MNANKNTPGLTYKQKLIGALLGNRMKCAATGEYWYFSRPWNSLFTLLQLVGFALATAMCVKVKSHYPYLLWLAFCLICIHLVCVLVPIKRWVR